MKTRNPISKIASLREKAQLTQLELSQAVGVTESTIANWEKGRSGLDWIEKLIRLCRALHCNLEDLIEYDPPITQPSFAELREMYKKGRLPEKNNSR
jgi:transcriptional regulator with XRE-family HTH domain